MSEQTVETWLEITITDNGAFISDWTHTMMCHWKNNHVREFNALQRKFQTVTGKTHTYHIYQYGMTYEQCKALAIWYHVNRSNGNFSKYRLD